MRGRLIAISTVCIVLMLAGFVAICSAIGSGVRSVSAEAVQELPGDQIPALMTYVESPKHSFRERNRAVWALGQLGDPRALPVLNRYFTGAPCDHEHALCQYELSKAIRLCKGGTNITAFFWRGHR